LIKNYCVTVRSGGFFVSDEKKIMRKVVIVHVISSLKIGGAETIFCDLIERLGTEKFVHHVIYFHSGPNLERLHSLGVKTYEITGGLFRYDCIFLLRLIRLIRKLKPDLMHTLLWAANFFGRLVSRFLRVPLVSAIHHNITHDTLLRKMCDRLTMSFSKSIVAVSEDVAVSLLSRYPSIVPSKVSIIENGVDKDDIHQKCLRYQKNRSDIGLSDEHFVIGSVGRFCSIKNYRLLLDSFALVNTHYPLTRLVLVGIGPELSSLKKRTRQLGLEEYVTFVVGQQAYGYYPLFDCFVLSSNSEGISIALLEALSFGLPVVTTHEGQRHPVIESGISGIVVPARTVAGLSRGISLLVTDAFLRAHIAKNGQKIFAKRFNRSNMVDAYQKLFVTRASRKIW
jgi:glycosyltransferase involved in cell wall biosynthesis